MDQMQKISQLIEAGSFVEALEICEIELNSNRTSELLHFLRGLCLYSQNLELEATNAFSESISLGIRIIDPFYYLAIVFVRRGEISQAVTTLSQGITVVGEEHIPESWWTSLGKLFYEIGCHKEAITWTHKMLLSTPDDVDLLKRIGSSFSCLQMPQEALQAYHKAFKLDPKDAQVHFNISVIMRQLRELKPAMKHLELAGELDPTKYDPASLVLLAASLMDFEKRERYASDATDAVENGQGISEPFGFFFVTDSGETILKANKLHSKKFNLGKEFRLARTKFRQDKIRVGYLSADFKTHATSFLIDEMIRRHDREKFEIFGFDFSSRQKTAYREGIELAFDEFVDVITDSFEDTAQRIAAHDIDILIDLKGYTENSRPHILSYRPGRIQVNYLAYPGTMGNPNVDYIIGDSVVTPENFDHFYSEHVVELPCCYQPNNPNRVMGSASTRRDHGLPDDAFVFSCFNHHWKYSKEHILVWREILEKSPDSVLWIMESVSQTDVAQILTDLGIPKNRIVVAPLVPIEQHLERVRHADLFLDTYPCGAHTTASDSINAGVPVLCLMGEAFHTRVSASLMVHSGGPEFVCCDEAEYIEKALACVSDPTVCQEASKVLMDKSSVFHPYNVETTTRAIEKAFEKMVSLENQRERIKIHPWWG